MNISRMPTPPKNRTMDTPYSREDKVFFSVLGVVALGLVVSLFSVASAYQVSNNTKSTKADCGHESETDLTGWFIAGWLLGGGP